MVEQRNPDCDQEFALLPKKRPDFSTILIAAGVASLLAGCAMRWQPQTQGPLVVFDRACAGRIAPAVPEIGAAGMRAVYHFVTQNASDVELAAFGRRAAKGHFELGLLTLNINGIDTAFATGPDVLRTQSRVDAEFRAACRLESGHIYLTHVRHNPADSPGDEVRAR